MKHFISLLAAASILLLSSGCASSNGDTEQPESVTTAGNTEETTSGEPTTATAAATTTVAATSSAEELAASLGYEIFKGFPKAENTINTVNVKSFFQPADPSLLCYGGGSTFFMWDGTVYRYSDNKTEPLFEKNAYNLNYRSGKLYFIENDDFIISNETLPKQVLLEGPVYSCDLETGELKQITEELAAQLFVTEDGIFYTKIAFEDDPEPMGIYRLDEKTGLSERLFDGYNYVWYGENKLKYIWEDDGSVSAVFTDGNKNYFVKRGEGFRWQCISGDYCYLRAGGYQDEFLTRVSMLTGEITPVTAYETVSDYASDKSSSFCRDFTVLNDVIYFSDDCALLRRFDENTGSCTLLKGNANVRQLYADDENLYGIYGDSFFKILLDGDSYSTEVLAKKELTE